MTIAGLLLDVLIAVLLGVTIAYCWVLNRRIRVLQDSKSELAQLLQHFDESTQRASESIIALQTASKKIGENIQFRIDKANFMLDDLTFMLERGQKLANQLEAGFAVVRARDKAQAEQQHVPAEIQETVQAAPAPQIMEKPEPKPAERTASHKEKTSASLEAVLERVIGRGKPPEKDNERPARERQSAAARSKAEQELLEMIKAGIKG